MVFVFDSSFVTLVAIMLFVGGGHFFKNVVALLGASKGMKNEVRGALEFRNMEMLYDDLFESCILVHVTLHCSNQDFRRGVAAQWALLSATLKHYSLRTGMHQCSVEIGSVFIHCIVLTSVVPVSSWKAYAQRQISPYEAPTFGATSLSEISDC